MNHGRMFLNIHYKAELFMDNLWVQQKYWVLLACFGGMAIGLIFPFTLLTGGALFFSGLIVLWLWRRFFLASFRMRRHQIKTDNLYKTKPSDKIENQYFDAFPVENFDKTLLEDLREGEERPIYSFQSDDFVHLVVRRWNSKNIFLIKKQFRSPHSFYCEAVCLSRLHHIENVPKLFDIDVRRLVVWMSYIPGKTLESLRRENNKINNAANKKYKNKTLQILDILTPEQMTQMNDLVRAIHSAGVTLKGLHYENVIIHQSMNRIFFIDFGKEEFYPKESVQFLVLKRNDAVLFNQRFGTGLSS